MTRLFTWVFALSLAAGTAAYAACADGCCGGDKPCCEKCPATNPAARNKRD